VVHSGQDNQFSGYDWRDFLKAHNLEQSMSRHGNCHDNAVAQSFLPTAEAEAHSPSSLRNPR
jgi:putative transposase